MCLVKRPQILWMSMNHGALFLQQDWCCKDQDGKFYLLVYTLALTHLRYSSFYLEKCLPEVKGQSPSRKDNDKIKSDNTGPQQKDPHHEEEPLGTQVCGEGFVDLLFYVFYLPLFFTGPLLTFNFFRKQVSFCCNVLILFSCEFHSM